MNRRYKTLNLKKEFSIMSKKVWNENLVTTNLSFEQESKVMRNKLNTILYAESTNFLIVVSPKT